MEGKNGMNEEWHCLASHTCYTGHAWSTWYTWYQRRGWRCWSPWRPRSSWTLWKHCECDHHILPSIHTTIHTTITTFSHTTIYLYHYLFIPLFIYVTIYLLSIYHYLLQHFIYTTIYMLIWKGPQGIQGPPGEIGPPGPPVSVQLPRSAENKPFVSQLVGYLFPLLRVQPERRESQVERDRGYVSTKHDCIVELKWLPSLIFPLGSTGTAWVSRTTRCHWITCKQLLIWPWQWNFNQSDNSI